MSDPAVRSVKVFSSLVPALLAKNFRLEVWEQRPGSSNRWTRRLTASPGDVEAIMADISSGAMLRLFGLRLGLSFWRGLAAYLHFSKYVAGR